MDLLPLFSSKSCQGGLVAIVLNKKLPWCTCYHCSHQKVAKVDDNDYTGSESVNAFVSIQTYF